MKREAWVKIDRRLHDHWKVRSISKAVGWPRWSIVGAVAYLWGLAEDVGDCLGPEFSEDEHELPAGLVDALIEVGWAFRDEDGAVWIRTREESEKSRKMRELAEARWAAEHARLAAIADGVAPSASGRTKPAGAKSPRSRKPAYAEPMRTHTPRTADETARSAREREREREREKEMRTSSAVASPPPAPDGAADEPTYAASAAMAAGLNGAAG